MPRFPMTGASVTLACIVLSASATTAAPLHPPEFALADHENLERNLRWILERERAAAVPSKNARVGVFADAGAWHSGARSIVTALESDGTPCRVLDRALLAAPAGLSGLEALVLPGGWAPFQNAAAGDAGLAAIRGFVEGGGRCLGICAGAYLLSKEVAWEGKVYRYALGLFDGTAFGPVPGLSVWPARAPVRLPITDDGRGRGLGAAASRDILYYGGPQFEGGTGVTVLARYPSGAPAIVTRKAGKGMVILSGVHFERPAPADGDDDAPPPVLAGAFLRSLIGLAK